MSDRSIRGSIEIVGVLAVVFSLILVAYEVRQTRQAILGDTYLQMATRISSNYQLIATNESLLATIVRSETMPPSELSETDKLKLEVLMVAKRFELDAFYYQYELGLLSEDFYDYVLEPEFTFWYPKMVTGKVWYADRLRPEFKRAVEKTHASRGSQEPEPSSDQAVLEHDENTSGTLILLFLNQGDPV